MKKRIYSNAAESNFAQSAENWGYRYTKRGWPDFLCFHEDGSVIAVEVKPRTSNGRMKFLTKEQCDCMDFLSHVGVDCFVSDGDNLERYNRHEHGSRRARRKPRGSG